MKNAGRHWELNPAPLTLATSALTTELRQPSTLHNPLCILMGFLLHIHMAWMPDE